MTKNVRHLLLRLLDTCIIIVSGLFVLWIVQTHQVPASITYMITVTTIATIVFHHLFAIIYRLYQKVWTYASVGELVAISKVTLWTIALTGVAQVIITRGHFAPRTLILIGLFYTLFLGTSRFIWRVFRDYYFNNPTNDSMQRALIVGAGSAGSMVVRQLVQERSHSDILAVGFIDDDRNKQNMQLYDVPVMGKVTDIVRIVEQNNIDIIVIAIPSLQNGQLNRIVEQCAEAKVPVQMLPKIEDIMTGKISISQLRNIEVEDLLGRHPVELDISSIAETITGKTVMVTGAGGSIGAELCRQLARFTPETILLVGHGENSIYHIEKELKTNYNQKGMTIIPIIGDVKDLARMEKVISTYRPAVIYHAAAHKHVPLMEYNPHESVKNNVIGTKNVAELAHQYDVDTFVLVSTDKAVNPTNVMGASKRIAEMVIQELAGRSQTKFVAVRFGNVLGSRGSVIPLFKEQIKAGGPVTVTHPDITRYFMTIPEASRLVIQAGSLARGGEIFVLDMGEPVKIVDLAKRVIQLSGYDIEEIGIEFTGLREGEKMFEELLNENEINPKQVYEKIYIGRTAVVNTEEINALINDFGKLDNIQLKDKMLSIISLEKALRKSNQTLTNTLNKTEELVHI